MSQGGRRGVFVGLHGHAMTGDLLAKKMGAIRSELKKRGGAGAGPSNKGNDVNEGWDFVWPTAPLVTPPRPLVSTSPAAPTSPNTAEEEERAQPSSSPPPPGAEQQALASWIDFWSRHPDGPDAALGNIRPTVPPPSQATTPASPEQKSTGPVYAGVAASVQHLAAVFAEIHCHHRHQEEGSATSSGGASDAASLRALDALFCFSQGTVIATIYLAVAMQSLVGMLAEKNGGADPRASISSEAKAAAVTDAKEAIVGTRKRMCVADDALPMSQWTVSPESNPLLQRVASSSAPFSADIGPLRLHPHPLRVVLVSGLVPRDLTVRAFVEDTFRTFQMSTQHRWKHHHRSSYSAENQTLAGEQSTNSSNQSTPTLLHEEEHHRAAQWVLRPLEVLNVLGTADQIVDPALSRDLGRLFARVAGIGGHDCAPPAETKPLSVAPSPTSSACPPASSPVQRVSSSPSVPLATSSAFVEWAHDGGHLIPSTLRKPLKEFLARRPVCLSER